MKKYLLSAFTLAIAINCGASESPRIVQYDLKVSFDKAAQKINTSLQNQSEIDINIRKDSTPFSLFIKGIKIFAFEDSKNLDRIPIYYPIGSNPQLLTIPAKEFLTGQLDLKSLMKNHCEILKKNSILIFWNYSAQAGEFGEYLLLPTDGVLRITRDDVICE